MSAEPTLQDLLEVQAYFGLPSAALVEKDWHVVRALAAITEADTAPLRLVFGGGTALSRAHRLIRRMSEDIDLKIIADMEPARPALRRLREIITDALRAAGFAFDPANPAHRLSRNESRYTLYRLPYDPLLRGEGALRPEIQIETAVWPLRHPPVDLPVSSFVAEAFRRPQEVPRIACVSVTQTAAEKFVGLTRRVATEIADAAGARDATLIRHVYDLHVIRRHCNSAEVAALARTIMPHDAEVFGHQCPAYRADPLAETLRAVQALTADEGYARCYADFRRAMVYDGDAADYGDCLETLHELSARLIEGQGMAT